MNNMEIWNRVCHTKPEHTKPVSFGRKFTAIDPMSQIEMATKVFGPVGKGWTYQAEYDFHGEDTDTLVVCYLTIQYMSDDTTQPCSYGPVMGMEELYQKRKSGGFAVDTDAGKKAMTDALTKALSHLGFNADVFLGLYDDQKYVAKMKEQSNSDKEIEQQTLISDIIKEVRAASSIEELEIVKKKHTATMKELGKAAAMPILAAVKETKANLTDETGETDNG